MLEQILSAVVIGIIGLYISRHYIDKKRKKYRQLELKRRELITLVDSIRYYWFSNIGYDIENLLYLRLEDMSRFLNTLSEADLVRMTELCYGEMISLRKINNASETAAFTNSSVALIELLGIVLDNMDDHKRIFIEDSSSEIVEELYVVKKMNAKKVDKSIFFNNISHFQTLGKSEKSETTSGGIIGKSIEKPDLIGIKNKESYLLISRSK